MINVYAIKRIALFVVFFTFFNCFNAQAQLLGLANSNYAGTHSLYTNPSAIADSRHSFYLNLMAVEAGGTNNYFRYEGPVSLFKLFKDNLDFKDEYVRETLDGKPKLITAGADLRGPALMFRLSNKHSLAFTTRVRGGFQVNNLSEDIARLYKLQGGSEGNADDLLNKATGNNTINLNANVYSELGLSYARVVLDKKQHFVKGGFTLKKLSGGYSAHLINEDTQFKVEERPAAGGKTDYVLNIDKIRTKYAYLTDDALGESNDGTSYINMLTGKNSPGKGWGTDIGFTYEYRPKLAKYQMLLDGQEEANQEKNKYKYRVAFSLMDIGSINYKTNVKGYDLEKYNRELKLSSFKDKDNTEEYAQVINNALGITDADKITSFRSGLPMALNLNLDYKLAGPIYANATWIQDLRNEKTIGMRQNSLVAVTPRLELKKLELALPMAVQNNYSSFTMGAMLRFCNVFIGSDNLAGAFNIGKPYGANVYMGLTLLPILKRNKKDMDKDGVTDKVDKCLEEPGSWQLMGCPDNDKDGVADADDACPTVPGTVALKGCAPASDSTQAASADTPGNPTADSVKATQTSGTATPAGTPVVTPNNAAPTTPAIKPGNATAPYPGNSTETTSAPKSAAEPGTNLLPKSGNN